MLQGAAEGLGTTEAMNTVTPRRKAAVSVRPWFTEMN